jgi:UDP-N-acetylmuramoyl-tripeptide--D-alanyl-D-alanine ligase
LKKLPVSFLAAGEGASSEEAAVRLARGWLDAVSPVTVGITGSVGKTTTRELLVGVLMGHYRVHAAKKSYNTRIGCSMTILSMPRETEILLLELGTNHQGEIADLVSAFPVSHGAITEVSPAHLEGLGSVGGVCAAKMEIARSNAMKFLSYNYDNEILQAAVSDVRPEIRLIGVGTTGGDVRISNVAQRVSQDCAPELSLEISRGERTFMCCANIYGKQNARNIAFAYAAASELGLSDEAFADAIKSASLPPGRGNVEPLPGGGFLIDDTYNANPDSVSHALRNLIELELPVGSRRIAVLGGMRELGADSKRWHEVVMSRAGLLDEIHLIGGEWSGVETRQASLAGKWRDADDFMSNFDFSKTAGSVILVKGSRYYALERLLPHFGAAKGEGRA